MTAVSYVPPNVLPPLLQKFAPLLKRKWFRELVLATAYAHPPPVLQQDRGLWRVQAVADRAHRAGVDLCARHRPLAPMVREARWLAAQPHLRTRTASVQARLAHPLLLYERSRA